MPLLDKALTDQTLPAETRAAILVYRGNARFMLGQTGAAISDYTAATEVDPSSVDALTNLGAVHEQQRAYMLALTYHRKAVDISAQKLPTPEGVAAHNNLA